MDDFSKGRRSEIDARGLMSYPSDTSDDLLRMDGIRRLMDCIVGAVDIRLPGRDIVVPWDAGLPAQLAYYIAIGDYEHHDIEFAADYIRQGDLVMELGGGVGITGSAIGKASGMPVVIVEPNPDLHDRIARTFRANGLEVILVRAAATGGSGGTTSLALSDNYWWSSVEERADALTVEVECIPLADLLAQHRSTVLVIDIEGHERTLVGTSLPDHVRCVLIEIHTPDLGTAETARIVSWLQDEGFRMKDVKANSWAFERA